VSVPRTVTMADIARRADVALSTVSYVFSGKRSVSEETRVRVLRASDDLEYRPHRPARALASGTSRTIALFLPSPQWSVIPVQQTFVAGATQATSDHDYALLLSTAPEEPEAIARLVERGRADGVILMETLMDDPRIARLRAGGHAFSLIGHTADTTGISFVDIDFAEAARKSVAHLAELGHRCVALFNFSQELLDAGYGGAHWALSGFEQIVSELGLEGLHVPCGHTVPEAYAATSRLLQRSPHCTAAVTTGWQFSGLLSAARDAGVHVPADFSVVSIIASQFAELFTPALTSVEWPAFDAGRLAAEMLIRRLDGGEDPPTQILIREDLTVRQSTAPPPRAA
jgi:DNA-binding LacI/PurR family transcriptional regulator